MTPSKKTPQKLAKLRKTDVPFKYPIDQAKVVFLQTFSECGRFHASCAKATRSATQVRHWMTPDDDNYDAEFHILATQAHDAFVEKLEKEADRRAIEGWNEPVFHKGVPVGMIRKFSDSLLIFRLKGENARKYKEVREISGPNGESLSPKNININVISVEGKNQVQALLEGQGTEDEPNND